MSLLLKTVEESSAVAVLGWSLGMAIGSYIFDTTFGPSQLVIIGVVAAIIILLTDFISNYFAGR